MNDIVEQQNKRPVLAMGGAVSAIVPQDINQAFRLADAIHQGGMSPYGMETPQKIMIAMLAGMEVGLPPMAAVQSVAVINNRPCMWGDALIGVVRSSSVCEYVREWIEGEGDQMVAYCETKRKGESEPVRKSFSVEDAKRAGLWQTEARVQKRSKNGGTYEAANDSPWYRYPKRMLGMRARAWCLRDTYADVLKGMQVREEVDDYTHHTSPDNARDITPSRPSLSDRLQQASTATQTPHDAREGFSATFDRGEPEFVSADEYDDNPNSDDIPTSEDAAMPAASEAGDTAPSDTPASSLFADDDQRPSDKEIERLRAYAKDVLNTAGNPSTNADMMKKVEGRWATEISGFSQPAKNIAGSIARSVRAIMKNDISAESAIKFHAEGLGVEPEEIGGVK